MTTEQTPAPDISSLPPYIQFCAAFLNRALTVVATKNQDYAGSSVTPMWNFENAARVTRTTVPTVLVSRMADKLSRLSNVSHRPPAVVTETADDTCLDMVGYSLLLAYYFAEQAKLTEEIVDEIITEEAAPRERTTEATPYAGVQGDCGEACAICSGTGRSGGYGEDRDWMKKKDIDEWPTPATERELDKQRETPAKICGTCDGTGLNPDA